MFNSLERKLSYEDIRFYRSIARSHLRKDLAAQRKLEEEKKRQQQSSSSQGWVSWLWGSSETDESQDDPAFGGPMTDEQRKQLYDVLDYDEKSALAASFETPRDALKTRIGAKLERGSFALRTNPQGDAQDIISVVFDVFQANFIQRSDNFEASISLGGFGVFDNTTKNTLYSQIVQVEDVKRDDPQFETQEIKDKVKKIKNIEEPFFYAKFEKNPLDERSDSALTVRMLPMRIIYHKGYVEAVYRFFKPPESQLESVEALLVIVSHT